MLFRPLRCAWQREPALALSAVDSQFRPTGSQMLAWSTSISLLGDLPPSVRITSKNGRSVDYDDHCTVVVVIDDLPKCSFLPRLLYSKKHVIISDRLIEKTTCKMRFVSRNQARVLQITYPAHHGTNTMCCKKQALRSWNQVEPNRNQARVLQITYPAHHGTNTMCCKNQALRSWNQVEPSRNQASVLHIIHPAHHGTNRNQVEPRAEPS